MSERATGGTKATGANSVHKQLRTGLEDYIKSQYFGKSPLLLAALNQHIDDAGGGADGGQGFAADKVANHKTVHRIVELLKQVAEEQRDRKHDQMPDDGAGRHVHGFQLLMFM